MNLTKFLHDSSWISNFYGVGILLYPLQKGCWDVSLSSGCFLNKSSIWSWNRNYYFYLRYKKKLSIIIFLPPLVNPISSPTFSGTQKKKKTVTLPRRALLPEWWNRLSRALWSPRLFASWSGVECATWGLFWTRWIAGLCSVPDRRSKARGLWLPPRRTNWIGSCSRECCGCSVMVMQKNKTKNWWNFSHFF